jgi:type II secretory pathway predicted ATPase ExeA
MYEAFYGFKEKPFSMLPDPGFLYLSKKHQAALTLLEYGLLNHVGFCIISGEPGAGKTTILRTLLQRIGDDVTVGLITNTHQSFGGLLDWVLSVFDLHRPNLTHVEMHQIFMEYLIKEYAKGRTVLLIVDEAQNMQPDTLEELRMLSNVNTEKDQLMQVVLAGQPALRETLRLPDLMQFAQRIAVDYHLGPLGLEETCGYIQHRLLIAGAQKDIFTPAACERIHNYSGGTPRLINLLCETVLVYGFADQLDMIDVDLVDEMVLERMKDSVVPIVNRDIARQDNTQASKELEKDFPWIQPKDGTEGLKPREEKSQVVEQAEKPVIADVAEKAEAAVDDQKEDKTPGNEEGIAKAPSVQAGQPASADVKSDAGSVTVSRIEVTEKKNFVKGEDGTLKQLIQYGAIAAALAVALIIVAFLLGGEEGPAIKQVATDKQVEEDLLQKREQEEKERLLRQLRIEAETLKKERDAAIAKAEEERRINLEAEKQSAAKAALAAEEAAEKRRLEKKKRIDAAEKRERKAKQAEVKAREEAKRAKRESAKFAEQRRVMQIRLDEERRLKKLEEARRLELKRHEAQRQQLQAAEASAAEKAAAEKAAAEKAAEAAEKAKVKWTGCSGPTARFKANCR